ncbi:MAG: TIGR00730 family Rossman fold protein [Bacteroidetes bacterium]|nr:TIGR00730 family Rossman fold protein [Bacteroidota bacterium]MCL5268579.1 TIGR00730 family Rossman fold protein [Bacteroidota bacterium]
MSTIINHGLNSDRLSIIEAQQRDIWRIFQIMAEFVDGFDLLSRSAPAVSIFGSARMKPGSKYYELTREVAFELAKTGYAIVSGGGGGLMEAANRGAKEAGGESIGLNIQLPFEQRPNEYIDPDKVMTFQHFFVRKVMFVKYAQGFVVMPGGYGTVDEFSEAITLIQTNKTKTFPVVLMGSSYWKKLLEWMKETALQEGCITEKDLEIFHVCDEPIDAVKIIKDFGIRHGYVTNF